MANYFGPGLVPNHRYPGIEPISGAIISIVEELQKMEIHARAKCQTISSPFAT